MQFLSPARPRLTRNHGFFEAICCIAGPIAHKLPSEVKPRRTQEPHVATYLPESIEGIAHH